MLLGFLKFLRGTLARLNPAKRGSINRTLNKGIEKTNRQIETGAASVLGSDAVKEKIKEKND